MKQTASSVLGNKSGCQVAVSFEELYEADRTSRKASGKRVGVTKVQPK
jgi:hypothetical protein